VAQAVGRDWEGPVATLKGSKGRESIVLSCLDQQLGRGSSATHHAWVI